MSCIARVIRNRQHVRAGNVTKAETETTYLISSLATATPETILSLNRNHWQIEIMHRDKDVTMGEDRYTNRSDHAPRNIFADAMQRAFDGCVGTGDDKNSPVLRLMKKIAPEYLVENA